MEINSDNIDQIISGLYQKDKMPELKALSELFSETFLVQLQHELNSKCRTGKGFEQRFEISIGWIDKIPLAEFTSQVKDINGHNIGNKRVEIGDLLLVYRHLHHNRDIEGEKEFYIHDERAIIFQAKASSKNQPKVPISYFSPNKISSTTKELALLSNWPFFDLYKASKSSIPLLSKVDVLEKTNQTSEEHTENINPAKYMGYHAKKWFCGAPIYKQPCNDTLGKIIANLLNRNEGKSFKMNGNTSFDKLTTELIKLSGLLYLPKHLFGNKKQKRYVTSEPLYFNPFFFITRFFKKKRKFPVIIINQLDSEGIQG